MSELPQDLSETVARALAEDVGSGDVTAALLPVPAAIHSRSGSHQPKSQTMTVPPPYSPSGMVPSNAAYSRGWSSVLTARRLSAGSSDGPFGTAHDLSTPFNSSRRS